MDRRTGVNREGNSYTSYGDGRCAVVRDRLFLCVIKNVLCSLCVFVMLWGFFVFFFFLLLLFFFFSVDRDRDCLSKLFSIVCAATLAKK